MKFSILIFCALFSFVTSFANQEKYDLMLSSGTVKTEANLNTALKIAALPSEIFNGKYYRYLQFNEIPTQEVKNQLAASGIKLLLYLPNYTFMASIRMGADLTILSSLNVRGLYQITPEYKMLEELHLAIRNNEFPGFALNGDGKVGITFTYYEDITHAAIMAYLLSEKMEVTYQNFFSNRITVFIAAPLSPASVYIFASLMGLLWLSTVPVTNAAVAHIFGVAHLSMLSGFVFFSHQIGSFLGVWLGGFLYDRTGSYDLVWYITIALGLFAGLINLPVREAPIHRAAVGQQPAGA